jgi:hypothetical protein
MSVRFPIIGGIEKHEISLSLDLDNPSILQKAISQDRSFWVNSPLKAWILDAFSNFIIPLLWRDIIEKWKVQCFL